MAEMTTDYLAALRELQPTGPYHLAGWSTGGIFAFALAEAIEHAGEEVSLIALFDAPLPSICDNVDLDDDARFLCKLVNFANHSIGKEGRIDFATLADLPPDEQFLAGVEEARRIGMLPAEMPAEYVHRLVHVGEANVRVIQGYRPKALQATVQFFAPQSRDVLEEISGLAPLGDDDLGWSREVGQSVQFHRVGGDHFTLMAGEPAAAVARELARLISCANAPQTHTAPVG
jgi:thioesterase domain-containing protein